MSLIRHEVKYEDTTLFAGYPARRPWYPLSSDIYQELFPSAGDAYPCRVRGVHANAAMRVDPVLRNTGLIDLAGGSAVFYDSKVRLVPVEG